MTCQTGLSGLFEADGLLYVALLCLLIAWNIMKKHMHAVDVFTQGVHTSNSLSCTDIHHQGGHASHIRIHLIAQPSNNPGAATTLAAQLAGQGNAVSAYGTP